jgi:RES domain-containing protein
MLEQLAHTETGRLPQEHAFIEITIPDSVSIETLSLADMAGWNTDDLATSRAYGDRWLAEQRTCVLLVPSVIVPTEYNVLINPSHADFGHSAASPPRPVNWDKRIRVFMKKRGS